MKNLFIILCLMVLVGCAGISIFSHPKTSLIDLSLHSITPDNLFFQGQLKLINKNPVSLSFKHLKLNLLFNDQVTINKLVHNLPVLSGYDTKIIDFKIMISRHLLTSIDTGQLKIDCIGQLPVQAKYLHDPIEFENTTTLLLPQTPSILINKSFISKNTQFLSTTLTIKNPNPYPVTLSSAIGQIDFKQYSYQLKPLNKTVIIQPNLEQKVKIIASKSSVIAPVKQSVLSADFTFSTSHGQLVIPIKDQLIK